MKYMKVHICPCALETSKKAGAEQQRVFEGQIGGIPEVEEYSHAISIWS